MICFSTVVDDEGKERFCGTEFDKGSAHAYENCCSLECWLSASQRRIAEERKLWDVEYYGYLSQSQPGDGYIMWEENADPRSNNPEFYRYKGWLTLAA